VSYEPFAFRHEVLSVFLLNVSIFIFPAFLRPLPAVISSTGIFSPEIFPRFFGITDLIVRGCPFSFGAVPFWSSDTFPSQVFL